MLSFVEAPTRWAWAEIDQAALQRNTAMLVQRVAPAAVWAVVKADAYGHGAVPVARAALSAGATGLCVALVSEGVELRAAGVTAPILVLSEQPPELLDTILEHRLTPTIHSKAWLQLLAGHAAGPVPFHLKLDTGMQRVGLVLDDRDGPDEPDELDGFLDLLAALGPRVVLAGVSSHLATADEPDHPALALQMARFDAAVDRILAHRAVRMADGSEPAVTVHLANSAAALAHPSAHRMAVRTGIALYGISPGAGVAAHLGGFEPVLSLHARVSMVKRVRAGSSISYGHRHTFERDTGVATVPIGYADGVRRQLSARGGEVLIGGRRRPIVGVVTMDQLMVDVGDDAVAVGDPVVLIGSQGDERITAEEWADRLDTIGYEVVCGIGPRVQRVLRPNIGS